MKIRIRRVNKNELLLSIYVFFAIFSPPFVPYVNLVVVLFSGLLILMKYRYIFMKIICYTQIFNWIKIWVIFYIWCITVIFINMLFFQDIVQIDHYVTLFNKFTVLLVVVVIDCGFVLCVVEKYGYGKNFLIKIVINAGLIESITVVLAFLSPTIKSFFVQLMGKNTGASLYSNHWFVTVRSYGFASTLVDVYGLGIAIIAGICFSYGILYEKRYIIYSFFIAFSTALNSRTGLVLYAIFIILSSGYIMIKIRSLMKKVRLGVALCLSGIALLIAYKLISKNEFTATWISSGLDSIMSFINQSDTPTDYFAVASNDSYWELPTGIRLLIGTGHSRFAAKGYSHTDNGYVNDIWLSGILGCIMLYGGILKMVYSIWMNTKESLVKIGVLIITLGFIIFNVKGGVINGTIGGITFFMVLFFLNYIQVCEYKIDKKYE